MQIEYIILLKSKKLCVKCRVNGELAYGRKVISCGTVSASRFNGFDIKTFFMPLITGKGGFL